MPRKKSLVDKLSNPVETRPGWRDTIKASQPEPITEPTESPATLVRKTYLLTPDLIERIEQLANEQQVRVNELVRYLLLTALDLAENEQLEIPTRPGKRQIFP